MITTRTLTNKKVIEKIHSQMTKIKCGCGQNLKILSIKYYMPHPATVINEYPNCWFYIECPNCGYQWALWKLGVKRDDIE